MATRSVFVGNEPTWKFGVAGIALVFLISAPTMGAAQMASDNATTTIKRGSEAEKALKMDEPSYQTREERLRAKPLDWNSTTGKPKTRAPTADERAAMAKAKPGATEGGAPNPKADEEARRLHPDDWKSDPTH